MACPHSDIGVDNCAHSEDAGVKCEGKNHNLVINYVWFVEC